MDHFFLVAKFTERAPTGHKKKNCLAIQTHDDNLVLKDKDEWDNLDNWVRKLSDFQIPNLWNDETCCTIIHLQNTKLIIWEDDVHLYIFK